MAEKVVIKTFSGKTQISCRQLSLDEYYDSDIAEIDSGDYILKHKIDRVEQHFYTDNEYIIHINHYDSDGVPYKFDKIKNDYAVVTAA